MKTSQKSTCAALLIGSVISLSLANAAVIKVPDHSFTPDGSGTTAYQQTDIATPNGGNVLPAGSSSHVAYFITTFTFGENSDAHLQANYRATAGQARVGVEIQDTGLVQFVGSGDSTRTNVNLNQDMAGQTVVLLVKAHYDPNHNVTYGKSNASDDSLFNVWINPTPASVEGSGQSAGDMQTVWNSATFGFFGQTIQNQSTPATAGDSFIKCTTILTGTDATFANALAHATSSTYTGPDAGNSDTWNTAGNWDPTGVPSGTTNVIIDTGKFAGANSGATPVYDGCLTLKDNATLKVWSNAADPNAYGTGTITMGDGSRIIMRQGNFTFSQPFILTGDANVATGESTTGHHTTKNFDGAITGSSGFTISGVNNNTINLNEANTFSSFTTDNDKGSNFRVKGTVAGSLGTGDVTINDTSTLFIDATDAMDSSGKLFLNGGRDTKLSSSFDKLHMSANQTVDELWIDGAQVFAGTYDNAESWLSGSGTLTVTNGPPDFPPTLASSDIVDEFFAAGPNTGYDNIWQDFTVVNYAVTFNEDMDETTVNPGDFENAGTATGVSIGAVTKTVTPANPLSPSTFNVEVLLASPSTGTLQLQVKQGADLRDSTGMALDTTTAIPDDTIITINAGPSPLATITGTAGGSDSWNDPTNWDNAGGIGQRVPFGPGSALVSGAVLAQLNSPAPAFTGSLTLEAGSELRNNSTSSVGLFGTPSGIILNTGSVVRMSDGSATFAPLQLLGDATITAAGNPSHHETQTLGGEITGSGDLTWIGQNNTTFNLNAASPSWTGDLIVPTTGNSHRVKGNVAGSLGQGDVTLGSLVTLHVATDAIGDGATLNVDGAPANAHSDNGKKLIMNGNDTVGAFFIDGTKQAGGTWGRIGGGADHESALISGNGILTVPVEVTSIVRNDANPTNATSVNWTVTFDGTITGLSSSNFSLPETGTVSGSAITGVVPGAGTTYIVTASNTGGCGTLGLDLTNDTGASIPISNTPFEGEVYDIDTDAPVISCAKQIVVTVPEGGSATVNYAPTAYDECEGATVPVVCDPPSPGTFPVGNHVVECTATDSAGNVGTASFNVVVLVQQPVNSERTLDGVSVRGDSVAAGDGIGPDAVILGINNAFLNNGGDVVFDASLQGNGANNSAVFHRPAGGTPAPVAVKGASFGAGSYGIFSHLSLNDADDIGFQSLTSGNLPGHFAGPGAGPVANSARRLGASPSGGVYNGLYQPALASNGELLTPAALLLGNGGVTSTNDSVITSSAGTVLAREGSATGTGDLTHGQFLARVVASDSDGRYAFPSLVFGSTPAGGNAGIFVGSLGGGSPALAVRKGDAAAGTPGTFGSFLGESVNSDGEIALRAFAIGGGVTAADNEGIWTNSGNASAPPVLVAREGDVTPCIAGGLVAFSSFGTIYMGDDGSVCFLAYLKDSDAAPFAMVNASNDASIWLWRNGALDLIVREGDLANSTDGAVVGRIVDFDSNGDADGGNGIAYSVEFAPISGDTTSRTNQAVYVDRGGEDLAPVLVLRRGDKFTVGEDEVDVLSLRISSAQAYTPSGSTGGFGRAINGDGDVLLNVGFTGSKSGIFVLGSPPVVVPE